MWAAAAGRCTLCNKYLIEDELTGQPVPIGELAHNVGWSETSPRGEDDLPADERQKPENLILVCRNCHRPIDDGGAVGQYTVEKLREMKRDHEARVRQFTSIGGDRGAHVVRLVGRIRGHQPELRRQTVAEALLAAGLFPKFLPDAYWNEIEIDLRTVPEAVPSEYARVTTPLLNATLARLDEGVRSNDIHRIALFAIARIPVLIYFGAHLDDKVPVSVFQRQRNDEGNAWSWDQDPPPPPTFGTRTIQHGNGDEVALVVNLSGWIDRSELPPEITEDYTIYEISPHPPAEVGPSLISSPAALASFESEYRTFLARLERDHGKIAKAAIFPAVPVSAAVTLGRALMPDVSPVLVIYDRDDQGNFVKAMEVSR